MEINHYAKVRGSQVSGFGGSRFAATRTKFIKLLSLGTDWAMLIKSSLIQTTAVQTINYTLVIQLVKIVQQLITTILTSKLAHYSLLSITFILL